MDKNLPHLSRSISAFYKFLAPLVFIILLGCSAAPQTALTPTAANKKKISTFNNTVVSLTFDDGNADNYQTRSVLKENNLRGTFYIVSGLTGIKGYMTEQELRNLSEDGNEIGGHTLNHTYLKNLRGAELENEICRDRLNLLDFGFSVISFAYPYGYYDDEVKQAVHNCGYTNARIVTAGPASIPPVDSYVIPAMPYIVQDTRFPKMTRYVTQVENEGGGWVIFTFHHVCEACDQFSISMETFSQFAQWLGEQQKNGLVIKTMGEVMSGGAAP